MINKVLTLIHSTHASLKGFSDNGLLKRQHKLISEYAKYYDVAVYTSDYDDFSSILGVNHIHQSSISKFSGLSHLQYFHWLKSEAKTMKGVIKVFGSNIPTLADVRSISGRPLVVTFQWDYSEGIRKDSRSLVRRIIAPWLERRSISAADLVQVTTKRLEQVVETRYGKPTVLIPNWVDFDGINDNSDFQEKDPNLIVYAGRLHQIKGINCLIEAFKDISEAHPKAYLEIFGCGDEENRLRQLTADYGITRVKFCGVCDNSEVLNRLRHASIFVLPTLTMEGQPKALLEAMACRAACIGSDVPGVSDIIEHRKNGLLFPAGDSSTLARELDCLLRNSELRESLAINAALLVKDFSLTRVVDLETSLFEKLLQKDLRQN